MAKATGSGQRVLAELSQDPVARTNKYNTLKSQYEALERRADYLATRLQSAEANGNQTVYSAILKQLQDAETRINSIATEMNSISDASRYTAQNQKRQDNITANKPQGVMDKVRQSLPYQIGSGVRDLIVDTGKGIGQTALYAENELFTGKAGTQGSVMNPEDIQMSDVMGEYATALGENTGFYGDALNSMMHWRQGRLKPDSEDEKYAKMFGGAMRDAVGTKPLEDDTVMKGARVLADPFVVGSRAKAGVDAVTDPKLWQGIADDISAGTRSNMFMPVTPWSDKSRKYTRTYGNTDEWLGGYSQQIQDAYKKFEELSAQGVDPREIFRQTRIFKNVDGVPYFETDDSLAKFGAQEFRDAISSGKKGVPLSKAMSHPELTREDYDYLGKREKYVVPQKQLGASYSPIEGIVSTYPYPRVNRKGETIDEFPTFITHETNHALASDGGLVNSGSSMDMAGYQVDRYKKDLADLFDISFNANAKIDAKLVSLNQEYDRLDDIIMQSGLKIPSNELDDLIKQRKSVYKKIESAHKKKSDLRKRIDNKLRLDFNTKYDLYMRNNGEALSRLAEARLMLDDTARRNTYPLDDAYFKGVTGYTPNETWFNKFDINKARSDNELVFPDDIQQELLNYLEKGTKPFKPKAKK